MSSKAAALPETKDENEPSMEEILASIRKIIADDSLGTKKDEQPKKPAKKEPEPAPAAAVEEDADVLDLAQVAAIAGKPIEVEVEEMPEVEPEPAMTFEPAPAAAMVPVQAPPPAPLQTVAALQERIISENTGSLVSQAFQTLARHTPMPAVGRSLEDVVAELLRPMLSGWLDDHLPGIVEKMVKAEIERVSRG